MVLAERHGSRFGQLTEHRGGLVEAVREDK